MNNPLLVLAQQQVGLGYVIQYLMELGSRLRSLRLGDILTDLKSPNQSMAISITMIVHDACQRAMEENGDMSFFSRLFGKLSLLRSHTVLRMLTWLFLLFVVLLVLCMVLDKWIGLSLWRGWPMLEAIGTVLAVFAAIFLAWWEGSRERRKSERQRQALRQFLTQEVCTNLYELLHVEMWTTYWSERVMEHRKHASRDFVLNQQETKRPTELSISTHCIIKNRFEEQLEVYSLAFEPDEFELIRGFYSKLETVRDKAEKTSRDLYFDRLSIASTNLRTLSKQLEEANHLGKRLLALNREVWVITEDARQRAMEEMKEGERESTQ